MQQAVFPSVPCVRSAAAGTTVVRSNAVIGMLAVHAAVFRTHGTDGQTDCYIRSGVQFYLRCVARVNARARIPSF